MKVLLRLFVVLACLIIGSTQIAAGNKDYGKYVGTVSLGGKIDFNNVNNNGSSFMISTTHGSLFNERAYLGIGLGFYGDFESWRIPIYAKWTYKFLRDEVTPYMGSSVGIAMNDYTDLSVLFSPEVGIYIGKVYFACQYMLEDYVGPIEQSVGFCVGLSF